jgi:hypothetical protein
MNEREEGSCRKKNRIRVVVDIEYEFRGSTVQTILKCCTG